jgi:type IV secretion system protein VirB3
VERAFYDGLSLCQLIPPRMSGTVGTDPLFLGLTRPPMIIGVSYTFAALNGIVSLLIFIITSKFIFLLVVLPGVHMIGWFICLKEPRAIELFIARMSKCNVCQNRYYHGGTNSYDNY